VTDPRLPRAVALTQGVSLQTIDYVVTTLQAIVGADGTATITAPEVPGGQLWRVERIVVTSSSANVITCSVYGGQTSPGQLRDWTPLPVGKAGVGEYDPPMTIESSTSLTLVFAGGVVGDVLTANLQYAVVQRISS